MDWNDLRMRHAKFLFVLGVLAFLMGMTGCRTTGDNPDVYWQTDYTNTHGDFRPELHTPVGDYKTSQ